MGGTSEFYCMVKSDLSDDVGPEREPSAWTTFRWTDEFGNSIAPFFTSLEAGQPFLQEMTGWQLKRYPVAFVVAMYPGVDTLTVVVPDSSGWNATPPEVVSNGV